MPRTFELADLRGNVRATVDCNAFDAFEVLREQIDLLGDLLAQLAGWGQYQGLHAVIRCIEMIEEWEAECRCFSRSCLSQSNEIAVSLKELRYGLALNVGGGVKAKLADGFEDRGGKAEGVK